VSLFVHLVDEYVCTGIELIIVGVDLALLVNPGKRSCFSKSEERRYKS
jgi:hypothetical protein